MGILRLFTWKGPKLAKHSFKKGSKRDGIDGFTKCKGCKELNHESELKNTLSVCPLCNYHAGMGLDDRLKSIFDSGSFEELFSHIVSADPLNFVDLESYQDRLAKAQAKTNRKDAIWTGVGKIEGAEAAVGIMDFSFMGGSMGSVVGEKLTLLIEHAIEKRLPVIVFCASGGARMQESTYSLMQMAKTSCALERLSQARLAFITVLTHPTMGGVTASFATLGDVILAEPGALIGFAGPRVIEQTIKQKLPKGAQSAEFLMQKGMIDQIVNREELKERLGFFLKFFAKKKEISSQQSSISTKMSGKSIFIRFLEYAKRRISSASAHSSKAS